MLAVDRERSGEKWCEFSEWVRSEPTAVYRDEMDMVSPCACEVARTEELLDFLERPRLNILDVVEVDEKMLDVSLDLDGVRPLVARRRKLVTPEVTDDLDRMEGERLTSTWKLDKGRDEAIFRSSVQR